ncbi:MAG: hypothetical protein NVS3B26_03040 [Mycobacteriales bacterium]
MTSTLAGPEASSDLADDEPTDSPVTALDLLAGGAVLLVALLAWASLVLAHLGAHSLPAALGVAAVGLVAVLLVIRGGSRTGSRTGRRVRGDRAGVVVALVAAGLAAALTFPGFSYGVADKDPGGYIAHAVEIAHSGDYAFTDPLLRDKVPVQLISPGARLPGVWLRDERTGRIVPQFYHLWPALLATAYDADGYDGVRFAVPLMGVLAVLCMVAVLRRVGTALAGQRAGLVAAGAGGLLLATNMLEVWQSRFPTTEVLAEALFLGVLLGIVVALQTRWRPAAGLAGLFVGVGWLNRADGLLLVLLAAGIGAALLATRRWDGRANWFAAGLGVVVPHALLQAYDLAHNYSVANSIPSLPKVAALVIALFAVAVVLRLALRGTVARVVEGLQRPRTQVVLGLLVCASAVCLLALGFLRPRLFGMEYFSYNGRRIRSYDEQILIRLSWFFTLPGFAIMVVGLAVVALRRWRASIWAVVLPTLVLFPVYAYSARNSTRMLWWTRRYVPTVLPGVVILIALAVAAAWVVAIRGRRLLQVPAAVALLGLTAVFLSQSLPLRGHDEWKGSFELTQRLSDLSPGVRGIYLWEPQQGCCTGPTQLFATPLWLAHDELSALLPVDPNMRAQIVTEYAQHFHGQPVFVIGDKSELPTGVDPATVQPVMSAHAEFSMWDESDTMRPVTAHLVPVDISVWRVRGT